MSKDNNDAIVCKSEFSLVRRIVTFFKLGEEGKIENFFEKQRKNLKREIAKLTKAVEVIVFTYDNDVEDLNDRIADAEAAIDNAYMQVDADVVASNAGADSFALDYWRNIELKEANLATLKELAIEMKETHTNVLKVKNDQIAERKRRMTMISATK